MTRGVSIPLGADDPVAAALNDPAIQIRLGNAARAFLGKQAAELTSTQQTAEAEAIAQEAVSRAWKHRDRFDASRDIVKWLVGFVINVAREFVSKRCRDAVASSRESPRLDEVAIDPSRPVEDTIGDKLLVGDLLEQLTLTDRQIVQMKYWQE